jgi:hypothetical protein
MPKQFTIDEVGDAFAGYALDLVHCASAKE